jgi:tripartite-type tricarboxylate transporter receptor subunit TctC
MLALLLVTTGAHGQHEYPNRPVRLIVPFPAAGGVDIVARSIQLIIGGRAHDQ